MCVCVAVCLAPGANRPTYESRFRCFWHTKGMPLAPAKLLLKSSAMTWRALSWNLRRGSGLARPGNQQASSALSGAGKTTRVNSKNSPTCEHCANGLHALPRFSLDESLSLTMLRLSSLVPILAKPSVARLTTRVKSVWLCTRNGAASSSSLCEGRGDRIS